MKKQGKQLLRVGFLMIMLFILWTGLVQTVDVQPIGPKGTEIGFAALNGWVHELTGVHTAIYTLTDWLGLIPVFVCMGFGLVGFLQMVRRKSLLKVDRDLLLLGVYYLIVLFAYLFFEVFPINYRPILIGGRLEASYPSSTTLLVLSVMPTFAFQISRRLKKEMIRKLAKFFTIGFSAFMVIGRLISGVHWITDILGGILLSMGLFCIYRGLVL